MKYLISFLLIISVIDISIAQKKTLIGYDYYDFCYNYDPCNDADKTFHANGKCKSLTVSNGINRFQYNFNDKGYLYCWYVIPIEDASYYIINLNGADYMKMFNNQWLNRKSKEVCKLYREPNGFMYFSWTLLPVPTSEFNISMLGCDFEKISSVVEKTDMKIEYYSDDANAIYKLTTHNNDDDIMIYYFEKYTGFIYANIVIPKDTTSLAAFKVMYDKDYSKMYNDMWLNKNKREICTLKKDPKGFEYFLWEFL